MAFRLICSNLNKAGHTLKSFTGPSHSANVIFSQLLRPNVIQQCTNRPNTFFNKLSGEQLWKSVVSVSNAGKRRGRGRRGSARVAKNLNKGQVIGVGKVPMLWPGLNSPVVSGAQLISHRKLDNELPQDSTSNEYLKNVPKKKRAKVHPLERGWTSARMNGRSVGPPDPVRDRTFEDFDTIILEQKIVNHMTCNMGRVRKYSVFAVTGNKKGLAGFALKKSSDSRTALMNVKNRAGQKLMYIERYKEHTVLHDFFTQFGRTKIFVEKKPEGYGLNCHRVIRECCKMIGIKDIRAKVEGSKNTQSITKAFFLGLLNQKTHQQLANEKKLHLVEFKRENGNYPVVVASPNEVRTADKIDPDEITDFTQHVMDGKIVLKRNKLPKFYHKYYSWKVRQRKMEYLRNQEDVRRRMYMEYGELRSFFTDKYPECIPGFWKKKRDNVESEG